MEKIKYSELHYKSHDDVIIQKNILCGGSLLIVGLMMIENYKVTQIVPIKRVKSEWDNKDIEKPIKNQLMTSSWRHAS